MRILLCEDDENLGMLLREYLQAKGFNADLFPDGEAGYKAFLKGKYDICVLDVMMPKKDGFALAGEIRTVNAEVPIIFLTARAREAAVARVGAVRRRYVSRLTGTFPIRTRGASGKPPPGSTA